MTVVVGLGLHRPMTDAELAPLLPWQPLQHDPDDTVPTRTVAGIPGGIYRPLARARDRGDLILSLGIAELHQYAGLSGGHKGVSVGCGARATLQALHHRDRILAPGVQLGRLDGNPFREAVDALGEAAGCRAALLYVPGAAQWLFGEPRAALRAAHALLDPWIFAGDRRAPGALLRVPPAKGSSLYQASRAASYLGLSPHPPLAEGATLAIDAPCPEGLGAEAGFVDALQRHRPPWQALLTGPPPTGAGAQRAVILALLAQRFHLRIVNCPQAPALRAVGIDATEAPLDPLPEGWLLVSDPFHRLPQVSSL